MTDPTSFQEIADNFSFLDDGEQGLNYLMELGETLSPLLAEEKNDLTRVRGCVSDAWLVSEQFDSNGKPALRFRGESSSRIVAGRIALLVALYSGRLASEIAATDALAVFDKMGLRQHLPMQRSAGLTALVERIRAEASALG